MMIRDAVEADLPAIVEIYNAAIQSRIATAQLEPVSVRERRQWFHEHSSENYPLWVALNVCQVAGWLSFHYFLPRPAYRGTAEISVYVDEQFRHQGIGRALVEKAIADSPGLNFHTLVGCIFRHNEASLRLFERSGFEKWGVLPHIARVDGVKRDLVVVGKHV
jgi:phosphinothricin acetyltransferase